MLVSLSIRDRGSAGAEGKRGERKDGDMSMISASREEKDSLFSWKGGGGSAVSSQVTNIVVHGGELNVSSSWNHSSTQGGSKRHTFENSLNK